jgi:hypothetical protein
MTGTFNYCETCGAQIVPGANFCETCGQPVRKPPAAQPAQAAVPRPQATAPQQAAPVRTPPPPVQRPAAPYAPPAPAAPKRSGSLWIILGACGCLSFLCIALVAVGAFVFANELPAIEAFTGMLTAEPDRPMQATQVSAPQPPAQDGGGAQPEPTRPASQPPVSEQPSLPEVDGLDWPGDIGQEQSELFFSDDFSTTKYNWAAVQEESHAFGIENGRYALHLREEDYSIWAYLPTEFTPTTIGFDAAVLQGYEQGAFGVMCHYQDKENFHFVSIDVLENEYAIGYLEDGVYNELMQNMWMPSLYLDGSPHAVNNFMVACDADMITLFINNDFEAQASTGPQVGGKMALYAETWSSMAANGFKVLFDNLYAFVPVQ